MSVRHACMLLFMHRGVCFSTLLDTRAQETSAMLRVRYSTTTTQAVHRVQQISVAAGRQAVDHKVELDKHIQATYSN